MRKCGVLERGEHLLAVGPEVVGDGQEAQLDGREPEREVSGGRLGEDTEEALQRSENGAVYHNRLLALARGRRVLELKALEKGGRGDTTIE